MVIQTETKIFKTNSRHTIYIKSDLVNDSSFPFKPNEPLIIRIEGNRLIVEKKV